MRTRNYGSTGPLVIVLHGGPGAPGCMAPVARGLADAFRVVEPFQRRSGGEALTVARHVQDLHALLAAHTGPERPVLVGSSWGAMLALAYAAAHPSQTGPLVLVGCGTFDLDARRALHARIEHRLDDHLARQVQRLPQEIPDPDERLRVMGNLLLPLYSYAPLVSDLETELADARGHEETWNDMLRLQTEGVYPAAFSAIKSPVLMMHGTEDPHPGPMIRASLQAHIPHLAYHEWSKCGHYPWLEKAVRGEFFEVLRQWLSDSCKL